MKTTKIGSLEFRNPILTASGTFGMGDLYEDFIDYSRLGGITLKTVTTKPRTGNPPQRIVETPSGLLNSIGLENEGFQSIYSALKRYDYLKRYSTNIVFSIAGDTTADFIEMARAFSEIEGIAAFELNLSCPNIHEGGCNSDSNPNTVAEITKGVTSVATKPFTVKLSPSNDFLTNAKIIEDNGGHAVTISNTFLGTAIDIKKRAFIFKNKVAGFSGPAVKPMALYNVYRTAQKVGIPVIASGGISSLDDAKEFLIAGAKFISIGTMNFVEPDISMAIADGLEDFE